MSQSSPSVDRRRAYRIQPRHAVAQCTTKRATGLYAVHDLSRGGVALTGMTPLSAGSKASLRLMIPGYQTMHVRGTVLRTLPQRSRENRVVIQFAPLEAKNEDNIGNLIVTELALGMFPRCLIASSSERELRWLSMGLQAIGVQTHGAKTPMEAISYLESSPLRINAIIVGRKVGECDGVEFASFVAGAYPDLRRILANRPDDHRTHLARHVVHGSLEGRWGVESLRQALFSKP
ncbi:MAG TPA: PilZ domain-containing protein [Polyangiaceae bacterium]|nr:MAG: Flagellar brake protein YcgR [Deltaproteobacteria bacterium ADurb.Bin207]HNS96806.1 PilZ domain-containing protein [Polyangiaceae bacterium]HNZ23300.1 PilZ domain-containing protein [Polyangiaceae bacterium]HOD21930.1 PilZ domain-containing protein [Polyangiaceae bacterium]HOE49375.1 PilZ domain-containing protein [Polyangiaceae bacterium]